MIRPDCPPLYIIDDDETTGYTKNQLQLIDKNEVMPSEKNIAPVGKIKGIKTYKLQSILEHKIENRKKFYLVKWLGMKDPTWEPASIIKKDVHEIVKSYEKSLKA